MSNEIKVGDRVLTNCDQQDFEVLGLHGGWAWLLGDLGTYHVRRVYTLTRIEPGPVTLTPKYPVGQEVRAKVGKCNYKVTGIFVGYLLDGQDIEWREDELTPVADVCPACKGTGKAEGSA